MSRYLAAAGLALVLIAAAPTAEAAPELAQQTSDKALCMKKCLDQNPDEKSSCAIECGLVGSGIGQPRRDCGVEYKECMRACGSDKDCRATCRAARRSCI